VAVFKKGEGRLVKINWQMREEPEGWSGGKHFAARKSVCFRTAVGYDAKDAGGHTRGRINERGRGKRAYKKTKKRNLLQRISST